MVGTLVPRGKAGVFALTFYNQFDRLTQAINDGNCQVGIAEAICQNGREELHITVTNETAEVDAKITADTIIGVDINEDCVALAALTESGIEDSMIIDYPEIKGERHRYFTMQKRIREVGQTFFNDMFRNNEQRFVHDQLHTVTARGRVDSTVRQFCNFL